jgi:hypothetical protein
MVNKVSRKRVGRVKDVVGVDDDIVVERWEVRGYDWK